MSLNPKPTALAFGLAAAAGCYASDFWQPHAASYPALCRWSNTCNTYVLRDGDAALLIDLDDGSVLDHLGEIGVKRVEWPRADRTTQYGTPSWLGATTGGGAVRQRPALRSASRQPMPGHLALQLVVVQSQGASHRPHTVGEGQGSGRDPEGLRKANDSSLGLTPLF